MFTTLFKRSPTADDWTAVRQKVEKVAVKLFAQIGTTCSVRAFKVASDQGSILLVDLRSKVQWTNQSMKSARAILLQGLNSELGFRLQDKDLLVAFSEAGAAAAPAPLASANVRPPSEADPSLAVTEHDDSLWTAFAATNVSSSPDAPETIALGRRPASKG